MRLVDSLGFVSCDSVAKGAGRMAGILSLSRPIILANRQADTWWAFTKRDSASYMMVDIFCN